MKNNKNLFRQVEKLSKLVFLKLLIISMFASPSYGQLSGSCTGMTYNDPASNASY